MIALLYSEPCLVVFNEYPTTYTIWSTTFPSYYKHYYLISVSFIYNVYSTICFGCNLNN